LPTLQHASDKIIYIIVANITACFQFPQILADATGALRFMVEDLFFLLTSHAFGLQAIQNLIVKHPVLHFERANICNDNKMRSVLERYLNRDS
jgi:hypothetical protein